MLGIGDKKLFHQRFRDTCRKQYFVRVCLGGIGWYTLTFNSDWLTESTLDVPLHLSHQSGNLFYYWNSKC